LLHLPNLAEEVKRGAVSAGCWQLVVGLVLAQQLLVRGVRPNGMQQQACKATYTCSTLAEEVKRGVVSGRSSAVGGWVAGCTAAVGVWGESQWYAAAGAQSIYSCSTLAQEAKRGMVSGSAGSCSNRLGNRRVHLTGCKSMLVMLCEVRWQLVVGLVVAQQLLVRVVRSDVGVVCLCWQ
jgi:hypothetical protein